VGAVPLGFGEFLNKPRLEVGQLVRINNNIRREGVVVSIRGCEVLVEVSCEPLYRKAFLWLPDSELSLAG
jgi:hypothetical protein